MKSGELIGERFEVLNLVGAGGMGQVFRARDRYSGEVVALKTLLIPSEAAHERFAREARLLAQLRHPGLVRYVAHGSHEGAPFLVMEWLAGQDLSAVLVDREALREGALSGPGLELGEALALGCRVAGALAELHQCGVVHRDIKPSNIFLVQGAPHQAKVLDLGVAQTDQSGIKLTVVGELVGSPCYMAPEQARGEEQVGPSADVWALGCVLYEALTGRPPFQKNHTLALLTSIALDDPTPPSELRPDLPLKLEALVLKMLSKEPEARLTDASEVCEALVRLSADVRASATSTQHSQVAPESSSDRPSLTSLELRVSCIVVVGLPPEALPRDASTRVSLERCVVNFGCELNLPVGDSQTLLVTPCHGETPKEQARNLARAALSLHRSSQRATLALVTGRGEPGAGSSLGDAVERGVRLLGQIEPGDILVDEDSLAFLETRFDLRQSAHGSFLRGERHAEGVRTLLGKVTTWVGRNRELNLLLDTFEECREEPEARVLLVTAPAGIGKTRLRHEFMEAVKRQGTEPMILHSQGDALSAGSPFVMLAPAIRRCAGVLDGEALPQRRAKLLRRVARHLPEEDALRVGVFLGEMVGIPFAESEHESLRAARKDASLLRELMRSSFIDWLDAECAAGPVLITLEDLHWGDLPSVQYLDAALSALPDRPLMVLASARPEVHATYPNLWKQHNIVELRLHRLSKRASSELVRDVLGEDCDESLVLAIAEKAEGNAFYLEELIRFAAEGRWGAVPDNVLGMVQTRLDGLDQEVRRVLRAASIFGQVFWEDGVRTLIGEREPSEHRGTFQVGEWLTHLCDLELVRSCPTSRLPGQQEYQFRHALVHEAAHEMLTETDRQLGHRLAGEWLAHAGEQDSLVLAEHFSRGGQSEAAIAWLYRAAEQAFDGSDFQATRASCKRARTLGAKGVVLGAVRAIESQAAYWQSDYEGSKYCGGEALGQLLPGSESWFKALGSTLVAEARVGDTETVNRLFESALSTTCKLGAESAQLVCLCRGTFQLIFGARLEEADLALARIDEVAGDLSELDAHTAAQVHHVRGVRAAHRADVATFLEHLEAAVAAFEKAGDMRNVLLERTTVAWCHAELGDIARARSLCEASLDRCQRQGAGQALTYAKVNLGYILGLCEGEQDAARSCLEEATRECEQVGNLRLEGWARAHLSTVYQATGRCEPSLTEARVAVERLASTPGLQAWARACQARALLSLGRAREALKEAKLAMLVHEQLGGLLQGDALAPWVFAECAQARGEQVEARRLIRLAYDRVESRTRTFANPALREAFYRLPDVAKTVELHARWWASDSTGRP